MSWAAHDFETYVIQKHLGIRVSYLAIFFGTYVPDAFTKWYVYGFTRGPFNLRADHPAQFHRSWPGAGFTHSIFFIGCVAFTVWLVTHRRSWAKPWALGILAGGLAHITTDTADSLGTMLLWPFWTGNVSIGMWAYAAEAGRYDDAGAYYSSLGVVMDFAWLVIVLVHFQVFRERYFRSVIVTADPWVWGQLGRVFPQPVLLALYRASMFYGVTRLLFWTAWAHIANDYQWDLSWGGPDWITPVHL